MSGGGLAVTIALETGDFINGMRKSADAVDGFDKKSRAMLNTLAAAAAAATAAGAAMVAGLYVTASETIDRQAKLARSLDSTTSSIQTLEYAADLAGISHEEMAQASGKLNRKLGEAITVGGNAAKELDRLGLSAQSLVQLGADERMSMISNRLVAMNYSSAQASASLKELGIKGNEMVAMMMDGGEQFKQANEKLRELNVLVSDVDASKIEAANDAWTDARKVITGVANVLAVQLAPYVQVAAQYLREASVASGGFKEEVKAAVANALTGFAKVADVIRGLHVVFKGVELVVVAFGAAAYSVAEGIISFWAMVGDHIVKGINLAITASNKLLGAKTELLSMPSESGFMDGLHELGDTARNKVGALREELGKLAMQEMPSAKIEKYLKDVAKKAEESAQAVVASRNKTIVMPEENEDDKKSREKFDQIMRGLRAGTAGMREELDKRKNVLDAYRKNAVDADASSYAQQRADIEIDQSIKEAELKSSFTKNEAIRNEQHINNLAQVAGHQSEIDAINAEHDAQVLLAAQNQSAALADIEEAGKRAKAKIAKDERQSAMSAALGLGEQLMGITQGHSRKAFEFSKKAAIASAGIHMLQGIAAGIKLGYPMAIPAVAAAAATGIATIQRIRSSSFSGGGGGGAVSAGSSASGAGGEGGGAPAGGAAAGPNAGAVMRVQGLDPNHLFSGAAMQTIATGLLAYQKDGGKVVFDA